MAYRRLLVAKKNIGPLTAEDWDALIEEEEREERRRRDSKTPMSLDPAVARLAQANLVEHSPTPWEADR
jgi:hypothetical protein